MTKSPSDLSKSINPYRIILGPKAVSVQIYNGSTIGWSWVKDFLSEQEALNWILSGVKRVKQ